MLRTACTTCTEGAGRGAFILEHSYPFLSLFGLKETSCLGETSSEKKEAMNKIKLPFGPATELSAQERLTRASGLPELFLAETTHNRRAELPGLLAATLPPAVARRPKAGQGPSYPTPFLPKSHPARPAKRRHPRPAEAPRRMRSSYGAARSDARSHSPLYSLPRPFLCSGPTFSSLPDPVVPAPRLQSYEQCRPTSLAPVVAVVMGGGEGERGVVEE